MIMNSERWQIIETLYHSASELSDDQRNSFLRQACGRDHGLLHEVESLLRHGSTPQSFLDTPAITILAKAIAADEHQSDEHQSSPPSLDGKTISHYRVLHAIGQGGMGVVYEAEDLNLRRHVALKLLPQFLARDPQARARFVREAQAASALNHPNICTVHEIGEGQGLHFIAIELLEGETLKERIARGPLNVPEIFRIVIEICDALEAAHSAGIIHRDIKPSNVILAKRGTAKLLDFGVAKRVGTEVLEDTKSLSELLPAHLDLHLTTPGTAIGTVAYMSPEQASGAQVDARSDLFSLGAVLYEMTTGKCPFPGKNAADVVRGIHEQQPLRIETLALTIPTRLTRIINKALQKDCSLRYQSATEMKAELQALSHYLEAAKATRKTFVGLAFLAVVFSILVFVSLRIARVREFVLGQPPTEMARTNTAEPRLSVGEVVSLTGDPGWQDYPAFSPDGRQVAYTQGAQGSGLYTMLIGGEKPLRLTSTPGDASPTWSPDGLQLAFSRNSSEDDSVSICVIPALGGSVRKLYTVPYSFPHSSELVAWSPTGKVLAFTQNSRIELLTIANSTAQALTSPPDRTYDYGPAFSPDGSRVAFIRRSDGGVGADLYIAPAAGGEANRLTFDNRVIWGPPAWTPDGLELAYSSSRGGLPSLWRVPASGGTPRPIPGVAMATYPAISREGDLAYSQVLTNDNIWRLLLKDKTHAQGLPALLISGQGTQARPQYSPDGTKIAFESDRSGYSEIWTCESDGSNCGQLTSLHGMAGTARWSPNGQHIAFEFQRGEHIQMYVVDVAGGPPRLVSTFPSADNLAPNWSRDGEWIYFASDHSGGHFELWKAPIKGGPPIQVTTNGGIYGAESADGHTLYFAKLEIPGIWKKAFNSGKEVRVLDESGSDEWFNWGLTKDGIYFLSWPKVDKNKMRNEQAIKFLDFKTGKKFLISNIDASRDFGLTVSPDGKSILFIVNRFFQSNILLMKHLK